VIESNAISFDLAWSSWFTVIVGLIPSPNLPGPVIRIGQVKKRDQYEEIKK
jgi:hypothetical protein